MKIIMEGIYRNGNLCDCGINDSRSVLAGVRTIEWILRRNKMRTIWNEYGGTILGVVGAAVITGVTACMLLPEGSIYKIIMAFSQSIC